MTVNNIFYSTKNQFSRKNHSFTVKSNKEIPVINIMPLLCKVKSREPEVLLFIHGEGSIIETDINVFSSFFEKHLFRKDPFKLFIDLRKVENASMNLVQTLAAKMIGYEEHTPGKVLATSILVNSFMIESLVNLLFQLKPPSTPTKITSDINIACDFINQ